MVRIGLLLKKPESSFSNGCVQQPLFLQQTLKKCGFDVVFIGVEHDYTSFDLTNDPIMLTTVNTDFSSFDLIVLASLVLVENNDNTPYIRRIQEFKVPIVNFICGNVFVLHNEEFVFNEHKIMHHYMQSYTNSNWLMEIYDFSREYLELLSNKPTHIVKYIWGPDVIDTYMTNNNIIFRDCESREKVNLLMFEPNMSIHKNSLIPLLIAENYYNKYPDRVNKIYLFCSRMSPENALINHLNIFKQNIVERHQRIIMPYVVKLIEEKSSFLNIVLSYQIYNPLNFIHLEFMHLGIPIIHNCKPFQENGLFFDQFELHKAVQLVESTRIEFDKDTYMRKSKPIIDSYRFDNESIIECYKSLVTSLVDASSSPIRNRFRSGDGYVVMVRSLEDYDLTVRMLKDWDSRGVYKTVEIIFTGEKEYDDSLLPWNVNRIVRTLKGVNETECTFKTANVVSLTEYKKNGWSENCLSFKKMFHM